MKEKSPREQSAAHQQTALLVNALNGAVAGSGYWLNAAGRNLPKFYPKGVAVSPFNSLVLGMHTDQSGYKTGLYTMFSDAKQRGEAILQQEHGVPFNWYKWDKYVNRHNSEDMLSREAYKALPEAQQKLYKGVRQREIMVLFNIDQTTPADGGCGEIPGFATTLRQPCRPGLPAKRGTTTAQHGEPVRGADQGTPASRAQGCRRHGALRYRQRCSLYARSETV